MAKKKNNKQMIFLVALLLGVVAIAMYFLPMVRFYIGDSDTNAVTNYTGFNLFFGADEVKTTINGYDSSASFGLSSTKMIPIALVSGILVVLGLVVGLLTKILDKKMVMIFKVVSAALFIVGGVLAVVAVRNNFISTNGIKLLADKYKVGIGAILNCVFASLAGVGILLS